jgi:hypothetical protein
MYQNATQHYSISLSSIVSTGKSIPELGRVVRIVEVRTILEDDEDDLRDRRRSRRSQGHEQEGRRASKPCYGVDMCCIFQNLN